ncbi:MAG TPA: CHAT domain-containing protein [Saprospiraceae bacterium]|nr:CHAT domain-containing protein [Saprospiraceae bacterium]HMQ83516.1 CHAT domain-containing protein [Saprospiraceae bacterium]
MRPHLIFKTVLLLMGFMAIQSAQAQQPFDTLQFRLLYDSIQHYNYQGQYEDAFRTANYLYDWSQSHADAYPEQHAFACQGLGVAYYQLGELDTARALIKKCLNMRLDLFGSNYAELATTYGTLSTIYIDQYDMDSARYYVEKELQLLARYYVPGHRIYAIPFNTLGIIHELEGNYGKALSVYRQALDIKLTQPGFSAMHIANTYSNMGALYLVLEQNDQAITYFSNAQVYLEKAGLQQTKDYAIILMNVGTAYYNANDLTVAGKYLTQADEVAKKTMNPKHPQYGLLCLNLGNLYQAHPKDYARSREKLDEAWHIFQYNFGDENYYHSACYVALGHYFLKQVEYDSSLHYFQKALVNLENSIGGSHTEALRVLNNIGTAYDKLGQYEAAVNTFQEAIIRQEAKYEQLGIARIPTLDYLDAHYNLANMYLGEYKRTRNPMIREQAIAQTAKMLTLFESMSALLESDFSRQSFVQKSYSVYQLAIQAAINEGDLERAFKHSEESKAIGLYASMKKHRAQRSAGIPEDILSSLEQTEKAIYIAEKELMLQLDEGQLNQVASKRAQLDSLQEVRQNLEHRIRQQLPAEERIKLERKSLDVADVQNGLLTKSQALIEYFPGDSVLYIFLIRPDTCLVKELDLPFDIKEAVSALRTAILDSTGTFSREFVKQARSLYQLLIEPIEKELIGIHQLMIIPDGALNQLPFEALLSSDFAHPSTKYELHPYLVHQFQIAYGFSATSNYALQEQLHKERPLKEFLGFAPFYNFEYKKSNAERQGSTITYGALNFSDDEVYGIIDLIGDGTPLVGIDATKIQLDHLISDYRIIHIATHAEADFVQKDVSFLVCFPLEDNEDAYLLYVHDIYGRRLKADMVVLSACQTALGYFQEGEGIMGLTRACLFAGAKCVVSTLWTVNDPSTKDIMLAYYGILKQRKSKDEALCVAKRQYIKQHKGAAAKPYFWAGFVPVGDISPLW